MRAYRQQIAVAGAVDSATDPVKDRPSSLLTGGRLAVGRVIDAGSDAGENREKVM